MAEWLRDTPWRQGQLLTAEAAAALGLQHSDGPDQTLVVVVTHDCDLAQLPDGEPCVEVIVGSRVAAGDGNHTHAKNARRLHVEFDGDAACWGEFLATAKVSRSKHDLATFRPRADVRLSPDSHAVFQIWLASRYRRSAFPDEFERRLIKELKLAEKIAKAVKPHGGLISGVFFDVDEGAEIIRHGPDDIYTLDLTVLHVAEPDFMAAEAAAQQATAAIHKAFKEKLFAPTHSWQSIELRFCEAVSESVLTYQQFKQLKRWRLEHLSLADDPQLPVLPE